MVGNAQRTGGRPEGADLLPSNRCRGWVGPCGVSGGLAVRSPDGRSAGPIACVTGTRAGRSVRVGEGRGEMGTWRSNWMRDWQPAGPIGWVAPVVRTNQNVPPGRLAAVLPCPVSRRWAGVSQRHAPGPDRSAPCGRTATPANGRAGLLTDSGRDQ
ncbi:hypothetical protein chiPu_0024460 [Chiloscyllium punctatum]|uniref:Uncharacterized protein n=1 Tax=Chiloscyllium punctatum TaxID=137246 RepID=A0A401TDA7_CHIPU|nr:hypothetical protein [Chiloscyllium punctatum]